MPDLTPTEREYLTFARLTWRYEGARESAILEKFNIATEIFDMRINRLIDREESLAFDPVNVYRLRRIRAARQRSRRLGD